jgi:membrane-bound ClpP family serine protease
LIVFEIVNPTFFAGFVGFGFLVAAFVAYGMPENLFIQVGVALAGMIIGSVLMNKKRIGNDEDSWTGQSHHGIGQKGIALTLLTSHMDGKVELDAPLQDQTMWQARSDKGEILEGSAVEVVAIHELFIVVRPLF